MAWDFYTEDVGEADPPYAALLPAALKDIVEDGPPPRRQSAQVAGRHRPLSPYIGSAPQPHFPFLEGARVRSPPTVDHSLFYSVSFHRNRTETLMASSPHDDGTWVMTDADRGIDIGQIAGSAERPAPRELRSIRAIVRRATPEEVASIPAKEARERDALQLCQAKVRELELPMEITSAEFQFDGKKLTFYYSATRYVDFRNLVRILFRIFGTRIWMVWYDGSAPVRDVLTRRNE
jgi:hypothetical protein